MNTHLKHLEFEAERLERKWTLVHPWALIALVVVIVLVVGMLSVPLVKTAWNHVDAIVNAPTIVITNPQKEIVEVREADGSVLTPQSGRIFYQRVDQIKNSGRPYDTTYVDGWSYKR